MTNNNEIEARVVKVIREVKGNKDMTINTTDSLIDDLAFDSVDFASLILSLEDEFGGAVDDKEAETLTTVKDIVDYIAAHAE